jgi:hypothetical protein
MWPVALNLIYPPGHQFAIYVDDTAILFVEINHIARNLWVLTCFEHVINSK